jgi:hypothetical protein
MFVKLLHGNYQRNVREFFTIVNMKGCINVCEFVT